MSLKSLIDIICRDGSGWLVLVFVIAAIIEITPIKINPIGWVLKAICDAINKPVIDRLSTVEKKLDDHIKESVIDKISRRRSIILDFSNSCLNGRKHTKEEFDFIISECDKYTMYCEENNVPNGVANAAIKEIKRIYSDCLRKNSFL